MSSGSLYLCHYYVHVDTVQLSIKKSLWQFGICHMWLWLSFCYLWKKTLRYIVYRRSAKKYWDMVFVSYCPALVGSQNHIWNWNWINWPVLKLLYLHCMWYPSSSAVSWCAWVLWFTFSAYLILISLLRVLLCLTVSENTITWCYYMYVCISVCFSLFVGKSKLLRSC